MNRHQRRATAKLAKGQLATSQQRLQALEAVKQLQGLDGITKLVQQSYEDLQGLVKVVDALIEDVQTLSDEVESLKAQLKSSETHES